jgi:hypothetical protein
MESVLQADDRPPGIRQSIPLLQGLIRAGRNSDACNVCCRNVTIPRWTAALSGMEPSQRYQQAEFQVDIANYAATPVRTRGPELLSSRRQPVHLGVVLPRMKRKDALAAIRMAGYRGEMERAVLLYVSNRVSLQAFNREFEMGAAMRQNGVPYEWSESGNADRTRR